MYTINVIADNQKSKNSMAAGILAMTACRPLFMNNKIGKNNPNWRGGKIKRICKTCGKEFYLTPALTKNGRGKFCSQVCFGINMSKSRLGKNNSCWRGGESITCIQCGKIFWASPSKKNKQFCSQRCFREKNKPKCIACGKTLNRGAKKYCSRQCLYKNNTGKNSPCWKGGVSSINDLIRECKKYSIWRNKVFKRDEYTCQKCGKVGGKIEAHHIKKLSNILAYIKKKFPLMDLQKAAISYKPLWDITNGITLCDKCHKLKHKRR